MSVTTQLFQAPTAKAAPDVIDEADDLDDEWTDELPSEDEIADMDAREFCEMLSLNLGRESDELWELLTSPRFAKRAAGESGKLLGQLAAQNARQRKELSSAGYRAWLERFGQYKAMLQARHDQAVEARDRSVDERRRLAAERNGDGNRELFLAVRALAMGIAQHRVACAIAGLQPEPHDAELWALLDRTSVHHGGQTGTLAEILATGDWHRS